MPPVPTWSVLFSNQILICIECGRQRLGDSFFRVWIWCRVDQERMLKLFKVFRDLQLETPPLDGLCQSIVRYEASIVLRVLMHAAAGD